MQVSQQAASGGYAMLNRRHMLGYAAAFYGAMVAGAQAQGTSRVPKLKIREIRAVRLKNGFNSRFVRVYTEEGLTGTGECLDTVGAEYIINNNFSPLLKGRDPLAIEAILNDLWGWRRGNFAGAPSPLFIRGMGGPYLAAVSGVEMALWDLAGKALGVPISQLMGGRMRERIPVYLHANDPADAKRIVAETKVRALKVGIDYTPDAWTLNKGFNTDKLWGMHLNRVQKDDIVDFVAGFRDALGPDYDFGLELHARYDVETGIQICNAVEKYDLLFVEEPIPSDNVDAMVRIRNNTRVPLAGGENVYSRYGFRPYLEQQALSILQPDMAKAGGLLETRKIAAMAETYNVPVAPHGVASPLATMAFAQVCTTIPNFLLQEFTYYQNKLYTELCEPVVLQDGYLPVSTAPGIGISVIEEVLRERTDPEFKPL
jgi:galactonate dehydratase